MTTIGTCQNCKWWQPGPIEKGLKAEVAGHPEGKWVQYGVPEGSGLCGKMISSRSTDVKITNIVYGKNVHMLETMTQPEFGCIEWTKQDDNEQK